MLPVRFIIIMILAALCLMGTSVVAQELNLGRNDQDMALEKAESFYNSCMKRPVINSSETTNQAFCACGAVKVKEWLESPTETEKSEFYETSEKELGEKTLIAKIYAPCLYIPMWERTYLECLANGKHTTFTQSSEEQEVLCNCYASGIESYYRDMAQPFLEMKFAEGRRMDDPIEEVRRSQEYYAERFKLETDCYNSIIKARPGYGK